MIKTNDDKIKECILNIDMICRSMYATNFERIEFKISSDTVIYGDLLRYDYLQLCIILDEIDILNRLAKDDIYLKDTLYVVKPAIKAIQKYTGIRKSRNFMIAHFNRDKKKNFYPWWRALKEMKLPRSKSELSQIFSYLQLINGIVVTRYYEHLKSFSEVAQNEVDEYMEWFYNQNRQNNLDLNAANQINSIIESRMKEKGITGIIEDPYFIRINNYIKKNYNEK